jgi:crotonobetainyl-CoA:carnitine CoA-transferase CaiB-like acyl-CoA transferase
MQAAANSGARGLRVLEISEGIGPAGVAGRLLADLGAVVSRAGSGRIEGLDTASRGAELLRRGKAVVAPQIQGPISDFDVVLVDRVEAVEDTLRRAAPGVLVCAITPYGMKSPWCNVPASEIALQAATGLAHITGFDGDAPSAIPAPLISHISGMMATTAVLSALRMPAATRPRMLDVAGFNSMFMNFGTRMAHFLDTGKDEGRQGNRYWMAAPFSLYQANDGYVMICVFSDRQWMDLLKVMDHADLNGDPRYADNRSRCANWQSVDKLVEDWTSVRSVKAAVAVLNEAGIPAGAVFSPEQVLADPILRERGMVSGAGAAVDFKSPVAASGLGAQVLGSWHAAVPRAPASNAIESPFAGLRVLEVGVLTAAPFAGRLLADLGAEVIKLEVPGRGDPARKVGADVDAAGGTYFHSVAAGKRSIALDLRKPEQLALALDIAATVDVVVENLGSGVLDNWGFGAAVLRRRNPSLIFCSISGFGRRGPGVTLRAYDGLIQARAGLMELIRAPGRPPTKVGISIADQMGPLFAAVAIAAAIIERDLTGIGRDLDVSMYDALAWILADALMASATGQQRLPIGSIAKVDDGYAALPPPAERYWPTTPRGAAGTASAPAQRCCELPEVVASEQSRAAGLIRVSQHNGVAISQIGSATGLPHPAAQIRGYAPRLNELADDAEGLARVLARLKASA